MRPFLSSNAQDFIEDTTSTTCSPTMLQFLSSNAQDFIEDNAKKATHWDNQSIPEQ